MKYSGTDFLEWYKSHTGTDYVAGQGLVRPEGISDDDWKQGQALYNSHLAKEVAGQNYDLAAKGIEDAYQRGVKNQNDIYEGTISDLEKNYSDAAALLEASRARRKAQEDATVEKLMRYIPDRVRGMGMEGSAMTETARIGVANRYSNALDSIEADYSARVAGLASERDSGIRAAGQARQSAIYGLDTTRATGIADAQVKKNSAIADAEAVAVKDLANLESNIAERVSSEQSKFAIALSESIGSYGKEERERMISDALSGGKITQGQYDILMQQSGKIDADAATAAEEEAKNEEAQKKADLIAFIGSEIDNYPSVDSWNEFLNGYLVEGEITQDEFESLQRSGAAYLREKANNEDQAKLDFYTTNKDYSGAKAYLEKIRESNPSLYNYYYDDVTRYADEEEAAKTKADAEKAAAEKAAKLESAESLLQNYIDMENYQAALDQIKVIGEIDGERGADLERLYGSVFQTAIDDADRMAADVAFFDPENVIKQGDYNFTLASSEPVSNAYLNIYARDKSPAEDTVVYLDGQTVKVADKAEGDGKNYYVRHGGRWYKVEMVDFKQAKKNDKKNDKKESQNTVVQSGTNKADDTFIKSPQMVSRTVINEVAAGEFMRENGGKKNGYVAVLTQGGKLRQVRPEDLEPNNSGNVQFVMYSGRNWYYASPKQQTTTQAQTRAQTRAKSALEKYLNY